MHKCLFGISDYCEFNWWNSCLGFDVMFGYVNLMIIKLLMMKLHAQVIYMCILCVLLKIDEVWCSCWWIVDEFISNWCCCCCYEMLLLMIGTLGNHNNRVVVWLCVVFESFTKIGQMVICDEMMFWFKFYLNLSVFSCL